MINTVNRQVSTCLSLRKETGNFWCYLENSDGKKRIKSQAISQSGKGVSLETLLETRGKLPVHCLETFNPKILSKSFQTIDDCFVALLPDDKRWIKTICFGILYALKHGETTAEAKAFKSEISQEIQRSKKLLRSLGCHKLRFNFDFGRIVGGGSKVF